MGILDRLFGRPGKPGGRLAPGDAQPLSAEADLLLAQGVGIIDSVVKYEVWGRQSSTDAVQAAEVFERAAALAPEHPLPQYLAICAYAVGLQGATAETMLKAFLQRFPDFWPAQALDASWEGIFSYPPYKAGDPLPPVIDDHVKQTTVVLVRDGYYARPVFISRCSPSTLSAPLPPSTPVALHVLVVKTPVTPVGVAVGVIGDDPRDPLRLEAVLAPFEGPKDKPYHSPVIRYLLRSPITPMVLIDPNSRILLARDAAIPSARLEKMMASEWEFASVRPLALEKAQLLAAVQHYQNEVPLGQFGLA